MRQVIIKKTSRVKNEAFNSFSLSLDEKIVVKQGLSRIKLENPILVMSGGQINWKTQLTENIVSSGLVLSGVYFTGEHITIYVFNTNQQSLEIQADIPILELSAYETVSVRQVEQEFNKVIVINRDFEKAVETQVKNKKKRKYKNV